MLRRLGSHLSFANVTSLLALFVALGGTAYAVATVGSDDIIDGSVRSIDLRNNDVRSGDVLNEGLTGADIKNQSGVDTCVPATARIGQLCVRGENFARTWSQALGHCANLDLRLPSVGEAIELAQTHDIPNVDENEDFWTSDRYIVGSTQVADVANDSGATAFYALTVPHETVCVTTPTN